MGWPAFDTDDFYWLPTDPPFQHKRPPAVRVELLRAALAPHENWVLAGSLCSWGDPIVPLFDIVVLLEIDAAVRLQRLRDRELSRFGAERIAHGGDRHAQYVVFMEWAARYETGGMEVRSRFVHDAWIRQLPSRVRVLRLDSSQPVDRLVAAVVEVAAA